MVKEVSSGEKKDQKSFEWMIPFAGIVLVLFATAMFGIFPSNPNNVIISIAIFGVGCAAIWFGLTHADSAGTDTRIRQIKEKADRIKETIDRSKK